MIPPDKVELVNNTINRCMAHAGERERATAHLPILLGCWKEHPRGGWTRVARNVEGFRYMLYQLRRFVVSPGPVQPGRLMWWSNGGGGGPEIGEAGMVAADALAHARGYALQLDEERVQMPDGAVRALVVR